MVWGYKQTYTSKDNKEDHLKRKQKDTLSNPTLIEFQNALILLEKEKLKYKTILELASDGIFFMDIDGNIIEYSNKVKELLGYTDREMENLTVFDWDKDITKEEYQDIVNNLSSQPIELERIHTRKDGSIYIAFITATLFLIENKPYIYAAVRDITKQKENEKKLRDSEFRWKFAIEGNKDGLWDWNVETNEVYFSPQWKHMLGFEEDEISSSLEEWEKRVHPDDLEQVYKAIEDYFNGKTDVYESVHRVACKDGSYICIRDRGAIVEKKEDGTPLRLIGTHTDITELYTMNELLKKQSMTDELTKLYNRKSYNIKLDELLSEYRRSQTVFSLILFDIDNFKSINDTFGHKIGDNVLIKLSDEVKSVIRSNDYFFRIGGEEFAILLNRTNIDNAKNIAEKVRNIVENNVNIIKNRKITISLGVTQVRKEDTVESIFKRADENLYYSKEHGRNIVSYHI